MRIVFLQNLIDILRGKKFSLLTVAKIYFFYLDSLGIVKNIPKYKIVFKFDDLINYEKEVQILDKYIKKENLKVCWGVIGQSLEKSDESYYNFIKENNNKNYTFFNHGYLHLCGPEYEFKNKSVEQQYEYIMKTQSIVFEKTGVKLDAFGAPCNRIDKNTKTALEKVPEIKYWFYGRDDFNGCNLARIIELEKDVGHPDFCYFVQNMKNIQSFPKEIILQAHPYGWGVYEWINFKFVIKFLKSVGCEFIFPSEVGVNNDEY